MALLKGHAMTKFKTWYMDQAVFNLAEVIEQSEADLSDVDFDTLVGTGFSGGIVIPALALAMGKKFVLIRKETDDSHHGKGKMVGQLGARWIFADDFVASGNTRRRVIEKIQRADSDSYGNPVESELIGQYMYCSIEGFQPVRADWTDGF